MPVPAPALSLTQKFCWKSLGNSTFVHSGFIYHLTHQKNESFAFPLSSVLNILVGFQWWHCFEGPSPHRLHREIQPSPMCDFNRLPLLAIQNCIFHVCVNILLKPELVCTASWFWLWQKSFGITVACPRKPDLPQRVMETLFGFNQLVALLIKIKALIRHWQRSEGCRGPEASAQTALKAWITWESDYFFPW